MTQEHNQMAAAAWSRGGKHYDFVSFGISDALAHVAQCLWPKHGERVLDVATGTGWSARNAAYLGANVVGVDIADHLLEAARALSSHADQAIDFQHADAEALPFEASAFDAVVSTFGVMFAPDQARAAAEMARVCRSGGRLVLATWDPDPEDFAARFFAITGKHSGAPPPNPSPLAWGNPEHVDQLLGKYFDLSCRTQVTTLYAPDAEAIWDKFSTGFGPIATLIDRLDADAVAAYKRDFIDFHEAYRDGAGLTIPRKYLLVRGVRNDTPVEASNG